MKKTALILLLAAGMIGCQTTDKKVGGELTKHNNTPDPAYLTTLTWIDSTIQDLGKATEGQILEVSYRFKNTGDKNLVIEDVTAQCGCTVPEKPEKPFAPGEEGVIRAKFDSQGRLGPQDKHITVRANTAQQSYSLNFKVEVSSPSK